ncbi:MAG: glycosyltransferase family 4 protein [Pirellulales bacterium]
MKPRRLALVTRRFWPLVGGAEMVMSNLATELRRMGAVVTIVTAQWEPSWPTDVVHREVPVVRLPNPPQRGWGTLRYMMALHRWLRRHRDELDLVYVSMLKHDAYAALDALANSPVPVVLRAEGAGATGDCQWQQTARFGLRIRRRCQLADALVAPSPAIRDEMLEAGYSEARTRFLPNGVCVEPPRDSAMRLAARRALAESNPDLATTEYSPVVVYTGRLHEAKGLHDLIKAWPAVLARWPYARLWLVGDGPEREELYESILELGLRGIVSMPGAFDDVQDVLNAADVFVLPSYQEGMSISLLEAMATGVPVVASDIPGNRLLVEHDRHGLLTPVREPLKIAQAIHDVLSQPARAMARVAAAYQRVQNEFSLERMAMEHMRLFDEVIRSRRAGLR